MTLQNLLRYIFILSIYSIRVNLITNWCSNKLLNPKNYINGTNTISLKIEGTALLYKTTILNIPIINQTTKFTNGDREAAYLGVNDFNMVEGYLISKPIRSTLRGYLANGKFNGVVDFGTNRFDVDDANSSIFIVKRRLEEIVYHEKKGKHVTEKLIRKRLVNDGDKLKIFKAMKGKGKTCSLFVLIDNSFLKNICDNDIKVAVSKVLYSINEANSIFRSTDFDEDGIPDNIGFWVKHIMVINSEKSVMNLMPKYQKEPMDGKLYLTTFLKYHIKSEVCLGIAFTAQTFKDKILGLSYTAMKNEEKFVPNFGGICERPTPWQNRGVLNNLAVSYMLQSGERVSQTIADISLAHELGHSFGSGHDVTDACYGHLMSSHTFDDFTKQRFTFSKCSKKQIIDVFVSRGHCLEDNTGSFCGNGIIEDGEECDCGLLHDCANKDYCCTSRATESPPCKVNKKLGFSCHPSQGLCCSSGCNYQNLDAFGINCTNFNKGCLCKESREGCFCGVHGKCLDNACHSLECTRINLKECACPLNVSGEKCRTCCLSKENKCLPSRTLTEQLLKSNKPLLKTLKTAYEISDKIYENKKYGIFEEICKEKICIKLYFRETSGGDYCLLMGQVGICSKSFSCNVPKFVQTTSLPQSIKEQENKKSESKVYSLYKSLLLILLVYILYL